MRSQTRIWFISLVTALALALTCSGYTKGFSVAENQLSKENSLLHYSFSPHTELEGASVHNLTNNHTNLQKHCSSGLLSEASIGKGISFNKLRILSFSIAAKDYLFHIYPSHNFW